MLPSQNILSSSTSQSSTLHVCYFATLTRHLHSAYSVNKLHCLNAVKPLYIWTDNFSIGYCLPLEWEHEDWVFMLTVPTATSEAPHWTPFTTSSLWDVKSGPFFFSKPWKCFFFSDCNRLPRQHVGAPLRDFRWRALLWSRGQYVRWQALLTCLLQ